MAKKEFHFTVQVVYSGTVKVVANNLPEAENRVRELVEPQGVFCDAFMDEDEDYDMDTHPVVHFLHHNEVPDTEDENAKENQA